MIGCTPRGNRRAISYAPWPTGSPWSVTATAGIPGFGHQKK